MLGSTGPAAPQHGAAERPLVCAVLEQNNLKQRGEDLGEELGALPQVLRYGLRSERGRTEGHGESVPQCGGAGLWGLGGSSQPVLKAASTAKCAAGAARCGARQRRTAGGAHCCCGGGALAAWHVLEVVSSQVVHRRRTLRADADVQALQPRIQAVQQEAERGCGKRGRCECIQWVE